MRVLIAAVLMASLAACSKPAAPAAGAPRAPAEAAGVGDTAPPPQGVSFQLPSGNIGCDYTPAGGTAVHDTADGRAELQCDRVEPTYVRVTLPEQGAAHTTETQERGCCGGETIAYGDTWNDGPFTCEVSQANLTCRSSDNHGFTMSRSQVDVH